MSVGIELVGESDLAELLPMMRAYCDFYEVAPDHPHRAYRRKRAAIPSIRSEGRHRIRRRCAPDRNGARNECRHTESE